MEFGKSPERPAVSIAVAPSGGAVYGGNPSFAAAVSVKLGGVSLEDASIFLTAREALAWAKGRGEQFVLLLNESCNE